jgi:hypothetical protein
MDCIASSKTYPDFEEKSFIYITTSDHIKAHRHRKSELAITSGTGKHITSIFITDMENGLVYGYGDNKGTTDLLLFVFHDFNIEADGRIKTGAKVDVFIARGKKWDKNQINNLFLDGQLDDEIASFRQSVTKSVTALPN